MSRGITTILACVAAASGCVSVSYVPTAAALPPKPRDCEIQVFSAGPPQRPYQELGILEGKGSFSSSDLEDVLPKLREEACLVGGDAIVLLSAQRVGGDADDLDEELHAFATVIRWDP
ncbi:MAG: hypothetical protein AB7T31_03815 [Gemmatimonadales bacterium]